MGVRLLTVLLCAATSLAFAAAPASAGPVAPPVARASAFNGMAPERVLDTRIGNGAPARPVDGGQSITLDLSGKVPASATAVVLNVTATEPTAWTFVTVFPRGTARTSASNLNVSPGETRPNLVTVALGAGRSVDLYNNAGRVHLVADLAGFYGTESGVKFTSITPARVIDTRQSAPVGPGGTITVDFSARVPKSATAVTFNLTGTDPTGGTFVTAWPTGAPRPISSNLNLVPGQTSPNLVTVALGADRKVSLYNNAGSTQLIIDLAGWFDKEASLLFTPARPTRAVDTRATGPVGPGGALPVTVFTPTAADPVVPAAVVVNLTGTEPTAGTHVIAAPAERTSTSNLNLAPGQTAANLATVRVDPTGRIRLYNNAGSVHLIADVSGYFFRACPGSGPCVLSWGANSGGELGSGAGPNRSAPAPVTDLPGVVAIAAGGRENLALRGDGSVVAWGQSAAVPAGQSARPVPVAGLPADVAQVSAADDNALALTSDGAVWAWGDGRHGQLGDGVDRGGDGAVLAIPVPVRVAGLTGVTSIAMGTRTGYAVAGDGTVWAWGSNRNGELGNGVACDARTGAGCYSVVPVPVSGLSGVIAVSEDGFALRADQTVWTWGTNTGGLLGTGSAEPRGLTPVQVPGLSGIVGIAGSGANRFAVRGDGTVWAWGGNQDGQLGIGVSGAPSAGPVQVSGIGDATAVAAGESGNGYAIRADGSLWGWGNNSAGQLGPAAVGAKAELPVRITGISGVLAVGGYAQGALALTEPNIAR
ncbi:RCC1 domain-containing protein [Actinokineospora iranica]|uniref:Alpha-tubulin suppressor n=1 Tax=Actinokineospora iranica TaxID=1271860 RepID=A0A1G6P3S5_9PSEU|nr:hypothetical protein [Actinokineospora iranica]SDC74832.1 Alpha-tubulin suppressor [Actinokineospora iranica]